MESSGSQSSKSGNLPNPEGFLANTTKDVGPWCCTCSKGHVAYASGLTNLECRMTRIVLCGRSLENYFGEINWSI